jgi:hypothetical protein
MDGRETILLKNSSALKVIDAKEGVICIGREVWEEDIRGVLGWNNAFRKKL